MTSPMGQNRDVNVTVNATVDPYVKSMSSANDITLKLADSLKKLDDKIQTIAKRAGQGIGAAGGAGIVGLLGSAREAAQLEKSFEALSAQTVQTGESINKLVGNAKQLSRTIPESTAAIGAMMSQVKALGIDGVENITRLTKASAELSAATQTAPGQLFTSIAELTRTFGNSIQNIERYGSSVTALSQRMGVSANGIVNFAGQIQAVANKAGVAETQVLGLSAAFQRVGADGFAGANAFNTVINDISDAIATNSSRLNSYANLLGMTREQFAALGKENPTETFVRFIEAIQAQGTRATQVLQQFGLDGVRTQRVFAALTSGQADLRASLGLSNEAFTENTATAEAANEAWDGISDSFERAKTAAQNLATTIGGPVVDALQPFVELATKAINVAVDLFDGLNNLPGPLEGLGTHALMAGSAILAIGGALTAVSWSAIKFLGVWRMVTGTLGINAFRGVADGLRGTTRGLDGVSRTGTALYNTSRSVGGFVRNTTRGNGTPGGETSTTMMGRVGQQAARGARYAALFPLTRFRQMGGELLDTARHPFTPELRNRSRTDPFSSYGMYQQGETLARRAAANLRGSDNPLIAGPRSAYQAGMGWGGAAARSMQERLRQQTVPLAPTGMAGAATSSSRSTQAAAASMTRFNAGVSSMATAATTAARTVGTGFGNLARSVGGFLAGPWGLLTLIALPFLATAISKLGSTANRAADSMATTGAEMANRLSRDFTTAEERNNKTSDTTTGEEAFGTAEVDDARSGSFASAYENTIGQINALGSLRAQMDRFQLEVNRGVQQNNGAPLDTAQQSEIRQLMINTLGLNVARSQYGNLDLTGQTDSDFYRSGMSNLGRYEQGDDEYADIFNTLSTNAVNDYMDPTAGASSAAYLLAGIANQQARTDGSTGLMRYTDVNPDYAADENLASSVAVGEAIKQVVADYNAQNTGNEIELGGTGRADDLASFLEELDMGNTAAQTFADNLRDAGLQVDSDGAITTSALNALAEAASGAAVALDSDGTSLASRLEENALNSRYQQRMGSDQFITSTLSNTDAVDYQQQYNRILEMSGNGGLGVDLFGAGATDQVRQRIRELTELKNVIGDPNDPTYQALDKMLGTAYSQLGTTMNLSSPIRQLREYVSLFNELDTSNPLNATQYESQKTALESMVSSNLTTLKSYYLQVRDMNRQLAYGQEDYNRSIAKSARDFSIQLSESYYQRNEQIRQADYSFNEQQRQAAYSYSESLRSMKNAYNDVFGNPAAFVQSQYTQGASSALIGMDRQVEYLKRSLAGLSNLRNLGVSNDVIKLLGLDDPTNFQQVEKYVTDMMSNPQLVAEFNSTVAERLNLQEALASDPSNSELTELNRQFQHSADEAKRAFDYAATEATRSFAHSMETSQSSYDRSMNDMAESYRISVSRTYAEIARIGEDTTISTEALLGWASKSGIAGVSALGAAIGSAQDAIFAKTKEMAKATFADTLQMLRDMFDLFPTAERGTALNPDGSTYGSADAADRQIENRKKIRSAGVVGLPPVSGGSGTSSGGSTVLEDIIPGLNWTNSTTSAWSTGTDRMKALGDAINRSEVAAAEAGQSIKELKRQQEASATAAAESRRQQVLLETATSNSISSFKGYSATLDINRGKTKDTRTETDNLRGALKNVPDKTNVNFATNIKETLGVIRESTKAMGFAVAEMLERVFNRGIIGPWNYISDKLGLGRGFGEIDVKGYLRGFAAGGYTGDGNTHDEAGVVHAGEWVTTKEKTRRYRPLLEAMHRGDDSQVAKGYADGGHVHGVHCLPGYAKGGEVTYPQLNALRAQLFPGTVTTSDYRAGAADNHGKGWAIDIGVPGNSPSQLIPIAQKLAAMYPQATELINKTGGSIKNGQQVPPSFWGASTWNAHANHVHWAMSPAALAQGTSNLKDALALNNPIQYLGDAGKQAIADLNTSVLNSQTTAISQAMLGAALAGEAGIINASNGAITKPGPTSTTGNAGIVKAIAAKRGWDAEPQWGSLYSLVQKESSFNNLAQNPTSTAYGLFQFLNSTWAGTGYTKTSDPAIQTEAGLKYIQSRYGNPVGAWNFHKKNNWYGNGGIFSNAQTIGVGEAGPETVLPLNSVGAEFVGRTIQATLRQMNMNSAIEDMRRQRTSSYATPQTAQTSYSTTDNSTTYSGEITVQASDPNEMQRQLDAKRRAAALTRPMARR